MITYKDKSFQEAIIQAINEGKLVLFIGAGVSRLCGLPGWESMANSLLGFCLEKNAITKKTLQSIKKKDATEKISIAKHCLRKIDPSDDLYYKEFIDLLTPKFKKKTYFDNYKKINELICGLSRTVVTTNADELLDKQFEGQCFYKEEEIRKIEIDSSQYQIWHIHGSIKDRKSTTFTSEEYLERYNDECFQNHMKRVFGDENNVILFVGYGLTELQILNFLKKKDGNKSQKIHAFALKEYFTSQYDVYEAEEPYFLDYGIQLVQYPPRNKYTFLIDVLDELKKKADISSNTRMAVYRKSKQLLMAGPRKNGKLLANLFIHLTEYERYSLVWNLKLEKNACTWLDFLLLEESTRDFFRLPFGNTLSDESKTRISTVGLVLSCYADYEKREKKSHNSVSLYLGQIIRESINNNPVLKDDYFIYRLLRLILAKKQRLESEESLRLIEKASVAMGAAFWACFLEVDDNAILNCNKSTQIKLFDVFAHSLLCEKNDYYDYYKKFYAKFGFAIVKRWAFEIFELLLPKVEMAEKNNYYVFLLAGDCLSILHQKRNQRRLYEVECLLLEWLTDCVYEVHSNNKIKDFINLLTLNDGLKTRLLIYLCNVHFIQLQNWFAKQLEKWGNQENYSEIYSCLSENIKLITDKTARLVYQYTLKLGFESLTTTFCAKNAICILFIREASKLKTTSMFFKLSVELRSQHPDLVGYKDDFSNPFEISKGIKLHSSKIDYGPEEKRLLSGDRSNYFKIIRQYGQENPDYDYNPVVYQTFTAAYSNYHLSEFLVSNQISLLNDLPDYFGALLINEAIKDRSVESSILIHCLELAKYNLGEKTFYSFLGSFSNALINSERLRTLQEKERRPILFMLLDEMDGDYFPLHVENPSKPPFNNSSFSIVSLVIRLCSDAERDYLMKWINAALASLDSSFLLKCICSYNLGLLYKLDRQWIFDKLPTLFNNRVGDKDVSFYCFGINPFYDRCLVKEFEKQNLLLPMLNSDGLKDISFRFCQQLFFDYMDQKLGQRILKTALQAKDSSVALDSFFEELLENKSQHNWSMARFITFLDAIRRNDIHGDGLPIKLIACSSLFPSLKSCLIDSATGIMKKEFSANSLEELLRVLKTQQLTNDDCVRIVEAVCHNLRYAFFNEEYVVSFFGIANWDNQKNKLYSIINDGFSNNPDLREKITKALETK